MLRSTPLTFTNLIGFVALIIGVVFYSLAIAYASFSPLVKPLSC